MTQPMPTGRIVLRKYERLSCGCQATVVVLLVALGYWVFKGSSPTSSSTVPGMFVAATLLFVPLLILTVVSTVQSWQFALEFDDEGVRLLKGKTEIGRAQWSEVDSIRWSAAGFRYSTSTLLNLCDQNRGVLLALPVPSALAPLGQLTRPDADEEGETAGGSKPSPTEDLALIQTVRARFVGREAFVEGYDRSASERFQDRWTNLLFGIGICGVLVGVATMATPVGEYRSLYRDLARWGGGAFMCGMWLLGTQALMFSSGILPFRLQDRLREWKRQNRPLAPGVGAYRISHRQHTLESIAKVPRVAKSLVKEMTWALPVGLVLMLAVIIIASTGPFSVFICFVLLGVFVLIMRSLVRTGALHDVLLANAEDILTYGDGGSLEVRRPDGERLSFPAGSAKLIKSDRGFVSYEVAGRAYITNVALLDPLPQSEEANG